MRSEYCGLICGKHLQQTITVFGWCTAGAIMAA